MLSRIAHYLRRLEHWTTATAWRNRLRGRRRTPASARAPGLLLIQVDGLARNELERALANRRAPFLRRLLEREGYALHTLYAGVPSTTPAVQGELFYGVRQAVPAFSYFDRDSGRVVRLYEPPVAAEVEKRLAGEGEPLLLGGSAYADVYTGGATEPRFCVPTLQLPVPRRGPLHALAAVLDAPSAVRALLFFVLETLNAGIDAARGVLAGHDLRAELQFIASRAFVCVLLRELTVSGARADLAHGLPVVHVNFLGYDEQAHRRGPGAALAHWMLGGIDASIARLWRAAHRSAARDYAVWIYADHGQEAAIPYERHCGRTLDESIAAVCGSPRQPRGGAENLHHARRRLVAGHHTPRAFRRGGRAAEPVATALGPVGYVYLRRDSTPAERERLAVALVHEAQVPLVLVPQTPDRARAWTPEGICELPQAAERLLGPEHPFLAEAAADLVALAHHPLAGELMICGWRRGAPPVTFARENGAHAGPGPNETGAFALLPHDAPLPATGRDYIRPVHLREAVLRFLGRRAATEVRVRAPARAPGVLRVLTYNVHSCIGLDGRLSAERVAWVIRQAAPDVVALQEVDCGRRRSGQVNQSEWLAHELGLHQCFQAALRTRDGQYGIALLSRLPLTLRRGGELPRWPGREPRAALWVTLRLDGVPLHVLNTHLGLSRGERLAQVAALLGPDWLAQPDVCGPVILCGDFNAAPRSPAYRRLARQLTDVQLGQADYRPRNTWFGRYPLSRIDHIFVSPHFEVRYVDVLGTELAYVASDHRPLLADLRLR